MIGGPAIRGEVGAVGDINIVPKLIGSDSGWGWWSGVSVTPRIITGGGGDGSDVAAHIESPSALCESGIRAG